ncbi:hypothetical protein OGAPHI_001385 [Ogataea philodendri]|uniref:Uncharacterized protein n=1 Tax=Ogataea philodendri TaxID=1378263 RepID=A0A9P8PD47_9ASCO|nr:uncharacterized protein OGAPHI_001385 [Ogataea philodendri]KAH3669264.1 hypothetical protein OGAPHI_001385 [Ogataea philodendri]
MPILRSARRLRGQLGELGDDYVDIVDEYDEGRADWADDAQSEVEEQIPEVDIQEMVDLANELLRNGHGQANMRVRARNVELAREIILEHDRRTGRAPPQRLDDRPLWMKIVDSVTLTLFPIVLLRIVKNLLSVSSFSIDILQDTFDYIDFVQGVDSSSGNVSLLLKFGKIIAEEFPQLGSGFQIVLTLTVFYVYTILFSVFMVISLGFLIMCLLFSLGKRWQSLEKLVVGIVKDGQGCI